MFTPRLRFFLIIIAVTYGGLRVSKGDGAAGIIFVAAAILLIGHFRNGPIRPALMALNKGRMEEAKTLVNSVRYPHLLSAQSRAYYHWIRGILAANDPADLTFAEKELLLAINGSLRTSNDRCLAMASLAEVVVQSNDFTRAYELLDSATQSSVTPTTSEYLESLRIRFREAEQPGDLTARRRTVALLGR